MTVNLEMIKRRVQELSGLRRNSNIQMWKPGLGEYKVRGLPWKKSADGMPFQEKFFYYLGNNPGILTPHQFGKPDPINELLRKLYSSGKPEDRVLAKKLQPKMRAYMPLIVRGQEDKGVQVWSFGKIVYQRLLSFFTEEDVGDILDPNEGFDLKVSISQAPGKQFQDTVVDAARRSTKLFDDPTQIVATLEAVPDLDDMYRLKSVQEIETTLNNWLNSPEDQSPSASDGTLKGPAAENALDKLISDVRSEPVVEAKAEKKPRTPKKAVADVDLDEPVEKKSLDDAFAELMKDDD